MATAKSNGKTHTGGTDYSAWGKFDFKAHGVDDDDEEGGKKGKPQLTPQEREREYLRQLELRREAEKQLALSDMELKRCERRLAKARTDKDSLDKYTMYATFGIVVFMLVVMGLTTYWSTSPAPSEWKPSGLPPQVAPQAGLETAGTNAAQPADFAEDEM